MESDGHGDVKEKHQLAGDKQWMEIFQQKMAPSLKVNTNQVKSNTAHFKISISICKDMEEDKEG